MSYSNLERKKVNVYHSGYHSGNESTEDTVKNPMNNTCYTYLALIPPGSTMKVAIAS